MLFYKILKIQTYANIKRLIDRAQKFDNQLSDAQQWDDKNFTGWLYNEANTAKKVVTVLPEKPGANIYISKCLY
ncbi:hypothetical protein BH11BAC5_BH11BAC5_47480 [soil metagenome]|jgi:hypothetical protein